MGRPMNELWCVLTVADAVQPHEDAVLMHATTRVPLESVVRSEKPDGLAVAGAAGQGE